MNRIVKRVLLGVGGLLGVVVVGGAAFVGVTVHRFNASMDKVYDVPVPQVTRSTDPAVLARGQHLAESVGACLECHGPDGGGGPTTDIGPLGVMTPPNISAGGLGAVYSDGELFRLIRHGIKKDGRSAQFMPSHEIGWFPDDDIVAVISYLRTMPAVQKPNGPLQFGVLAKVLDRFDMLVLDTARRIDHEKPEVASKPTATAEYGRHIAKGCTGCHGEHLSGGPIPGAPPEFPVPLNLTSDETGLKGWTFVDFERLLAEGIRKNGKKLDPFMPIKTYNKMDATEKQALWAYLAELPPRPLGGR